MIDKSLGIFLIVLFGISGMAMANAGIGKNHSHCYRLKRALHGINPSPTA